MRSRTTRSRKPPARSDQAARNRASNASKSRRHYSNKAADRHFAAGMFYGEISECGWKDKLRNRTAYFASVFWMDEIVTHLEDLGMKPIGKVWNQPQGGAHG